MARLKVTYPNDTHQCEFSGEPKDGFYTECQNIAARQVFLRDISDGSDDEGRYIWVCEDCLPSALECWAELEIAAEF
jgi:hypothetical protein